MTGLTIIALLLAGSQASAGRSDPAAALPGILEVQRLNLRARSLYVSTEYLQARTFFTEAADLAQRYNDTRSAAMSWNNAGVSSFEAKQYRAARSDFEHARFLAEKGRHHHERLFVMNSLADFYDVTGQPEQALLVARQALEEPFGEMDRDVRARMLCQVGNALAQLKRFDEAVPYYLRGINALLDVGDYDMATRALAALGDYGSSADATASHLKIAEWALSMGLEISRLPGTIGPASTLTGLGQLRTAEGRPAEALRFFDAALSAPRGTQAPWRIYAQRGRARLDMSDLRGALADFREARRIAFSERADMVPADQDRVAFESGLSMIMEGLINAGNSLALKTGDRAILEETFNTAEEDRQWSLRVLVPSPNDWRDRLPPRYWELLSEYQSSLRGSRQTKANEIGSELQRIEAQSAGPDPGGLHSESALQHARGLLGKDSVLFSFQTSESGCWLWAVDDQRADLYPLPPIRILRARTTELVHAIENGFPSTEIGLQVYRDLFGAVASRYIHHPRWSLELDGPLYELPFSALVTTMTDGRPVYLVEQASIQSVPGALMMRRPSPGGDGLIVGIGDPIYNVADDRYRGKRVIPDLDLPRLSNTGPELQAAARAWNAPGKALLLTGPDAEPNHIRHAIANGAAVLHFATHVIPGDGDFGSGMIALSLNQRAEMQLLGPKEIVATPVRVRLVVMNGCHSAQGKALPSAGLMGLTRAWIGAGAEAVIATQWDIPDANAQDFVVDLYTPLRSAPEEPAEALRHAQMAAIRRGEPPSAWAAYSIWSRIQ